MQVFIFQPANMPGWCIAGFKASAWSQRPTARTRCAARRLLRFIGRPATCVQSNFSSAIPSWKAPSDISELRWTTLWILPSRSTSYASTTGFHAGGRFRAISRHSPGVSLRRNCCSWTAPLFPHSVWGKNVAANRPAKHPRDASQSGNWTKVPAPDMNLTCRPPTEGPIPLPSSSDVLPDIGQRGSQIVAKIRHFRPSQARIRPS